MKQGPYCAKINGLVLFVAIPLSLFGAMRWGLPGAAAGSVAAIYVERYVSLRRISALTATPMRDLQDWKTLAGLLAAAAIAAAVAGVAMHFTHWNAFATLAVGGAVVAATYPLALYLTGQWGELTQFFDSLRRHHG
jgi:peptidoglycan biosynthesis protein MviN/MurJ (putative lipid II flippase)